MSIQVALHHRTTYLYDRPVSLGPQIVRKGSIAVDGVSLTLVDVAAVRFFSTCEHSGIELLHCAPYIRQWMTSERISH